MLFYSAPFLYALTILFLFTSATVVIFKIAEWVLLWQIKEYRTDRMIHFLTTATGTSILSNPCTRLELAFFVLFLLLQILGTTSMSLVLIPALAFIVLLLIEIYTYISQPRMPAWTAKAIFLAVVTCVVVYVTGILLYEYAFLAETLIASAAVLVAPVMVSALAIILRPLTTIQYQHTVQEARKKIELIQPTVIGIIGSYGKTTTKEFLTTILQEKFNVIATPGNTNTDLGIARAILNELRPDHELFIVEMGSYTPGEISSICRLTSPIIGIVIGINEHRLALFGDIETIKKSKSELLSALPSSGLAVINRDNQPSLDIASVAKSKKVFFSTEDIAHVYVSDVIVGTHDISFTLHIGEEKQTAYTRLHGKQVLAAICAAAAVADYLGIPLCDIVRGIERCESVAGAMHLHHGIHHALVIDNRYSSNPDSCIAGLDYLDLFREKRKIIITPGMIELGAESDMHHRTIGARMGEVADVLIITKEDHVKSLRDAAKQAGLLDEYIIVENKPQRVAAYITAHCTENDVILMEGMLHPTIRNALFAKNKKS